MNPPQKTLSSCSSFLALCLCAAAFVLLGGFALYKSSLAPTPGAQFATDAPVITATALPQSLPTDKDAAISASMDEIERQVSEIRGLSLESPIPRKLLTEEELPATVENDFFKDYSAEDAASDVRVLSLLGLLPRDFDLLTFYQKLYSEQIAGYYDDDVKAMFVVKNSGYGGVERDTYAHEFTHALQDAIFDFNGAMNYTDEACKQDSSARRLASSSKATRPSPIPSGCKPTPPSRIFATCSASTKTTKARSTIPRRRTCRKIFSSPTNRGLLLSNPSTSRAATKQ